MNKDTQRMQQLVEEISKLQYPLVKHLEIKSALALCLGVFIGNFFMWPLVYPNANYFISFIGGLLAALITAILHSFSKIMTYNTSLKNYTDNLLSIEKRKMKQN